MTMTDPTTTPLASIDWEAACPTAMRERIARATDEVARWKAAMPDIDAIRDMLQWAQRGANATHDAAKAAGLKVDTQAVIFDGVGAGDLFTALAVISEDIDPDRWLGGDFQ